MDSNPLKEAFSKAIDEARRLFSEYRFERMDPHQLPDKVIIQAWKGSIKCDEKDVGIIVGFTSSFPDDLPRIYLTENFQYLPIPHVNGTNFVCTFETADIDFFSERTRSLILETIEKARSIIADGISGKNIHDFENEFLAYWPIGSKGNKIYSILEPFNEITEIEIATVDSSVKGLTFVAGYDEDEIRSFLKKLLGKANIKKFAKGLFLPVQQIPKPPFPKDNRELFKYLRVVNPAYAQAVTEFVLKNGYCGTVIFSVNIHGQIGLASWQHTSPGKKHLNKGFRPGKVSHDVLMSRLATQRIIRCNVERLDYDRIQRRTGSNKSTMRTKRVCIIGCGSLGSHIAFYLSSLGVGNFVLIDNDDLLPENIARHLCGMNEMNQKKVDAVATKIESHFPYTEIDTNYNSFHKVFVETPDDILSSDLIVSATANTAIERRLNRLQILSPEFPPVLYSWIEPYGIASHAILIIKEHGGCFECCLDPTTLQYIFSVAKFNRNKISLQEAGCQTTFTPYSALEANQASSLATRLVAAYLCGEIVTSTRFAWIGNLDALKSLDALQNPIYEHSSFFSIQRAEIDKAESCPVCTK